jgi:DNA repair exonuclease SbcCD ATPase subunit
LEFLQAFDINIYNEELLVQENYVHMLDSVLASTKTLSEAKDRLLDQTKILETVPCGDEYKTCSFKTGAYKALEDLTLNERQLAGIRSNCDEINEKIDKPRREELKTLINKYEKVVENKNNISRTILEAKLKCRNLDDNTSKLEAEVDKLQQQEETYFDNKEKIDSKDKLVKILVTKEAEKENKQKQINVCRKAVMALVKENGSIEAKITVCQEERERKEQLEKDYAVYDLYQRCMHSSGISYNIIKKRLPIINNEIAKILTNIVDFEMFFENDGKHLKMFIKHPKHEPRPLEMGSGAEKTISAMAIRLALLTVSSLPKSDIFILDEPGSALDADNMDGFVSLLDLVKSHFNTILLISHLESLKDCADQQITIEKNNGYAYVSV